MVSGKWSNHSGKRVTLFLEMEKAAVQLEVELNDHLNYCSAGKQNEETIRNIHSASRHPQHIKEETKCEDNGNGDERRYFPLCGWNGQAADVFRGVGSIGDGLQVPLTMFVLSDVINEYGHLDSAVSTRLVNRLLYVAVGVGLSAFVEGLCWARTAERQTSRMRLEYLKSVLRQEVGFFDSQAVDSSTTYQVVSTISSDSNTIQVTIGEKIPDCLAYMSSFFFCLIFAFTLSWRLTLAAIPFTLMFIVPGLGFGKMMMDVAIKGIESYAVAGGVAEQAISSIRTVYSYVAENQTLEMFSNALQKTMELGIKQGFARGLMMGSMGVIYISWGFQAWIAITEAKSAAARITEMIDRQPAIDADDKKGKALSYVRGEIQFKGVYFSYPSRPDAPILQGLDLTVPAGRTRTSCLGRRTTMEDVEKAAKAANAHDFIVKLPDAYETQVGQFGVQLSGGQKQRIAIARALIRNPKLLLLDEATSALDTESERIVQKAIDQASKGRTVIVVAHRLSTIKTANLIMVLKLGRVVESGSHDELMQLSGGEYNNMVELQQSAGENDSAANFNPQSGRNNNRMIVPASPASVMSSPRTPSLYPLSPAFSMSGPYSAPFSVQYEDAYDSDDEDSNQPAYPAPSQLRLLKMNEPEWGKALLGCFGAIGSGAVQPINAYCVGGLIAVYFRPDKSSIPSHARIYSLVFLALGVFNFFTNLLQHYNFAIMGERLTKRIREMLLKKLMTFEIGWFDQDENTSAAISARLSTEANMVRSLVGDRMSLLAQAIFGATFAYTLGLVLTWRLALVMMTAQPLLIGSFYARSVLMKSMSAKAQIAQREGSQLASEAVINHRTITAFSSQKRILGLFRDTLEGPRKESIRQSWFAGVGLFSSQFLAAASTALAYWYGGRLLAKGLISPQRLFQAFLALLFTAYTIAEAGSMTNDISRGSNAVRSVFAVLDRKSEIDPESSDRRKTESIRGRVELRKVVFAYPSRPDQLILKGLSLRINAGTTVALVGQSGSGKSTIISLIERFYDPINGSVCIDDKDIRDYNLRSLRSHIALVSQEPTLFAGTIYENIAYGEKNARESEIRKAAILANAHDFISGMKDGYETYCGERGVQLSGGQKQRIALARAILKDPAILLLDEATSALDSVSESLVQEALEKMMVGRTCIVVAHRLSTIQKSNSIAVIKDGKVVEQGSHSDLMAMGNRSAYVSLVRPQGGSSLTAEK
ncbi:putative multidrug resistance protein [Sesamum angolense]|uniref:Multidrug resistance protein n=1 Tax=Sesamum angolense TaxID=2727404 RepID=A0AAE1W573_9LAMI|nr:putative multidrug resistance protein [Sesamum angolense]